MAHNESENARVVNSLDEAIDVVLTSGLALPGSEGGPGAFYVPFAPIDIFDFGILDHAGEVVFRSLGFPDHVDEYLKDCFHSVRKQMKYSIHEYQEDEGAGSLVFLYINKSDIQSFDIFVRERTGIDNIRNCEFLVITISSDYFNSILIASGVSLGLTASQAYLMAALCRNGDLRAAARQCEIRYSTARRTLFDSMRRLSVSKQSSAVLTVFEASFGPVPYSESFELRLMQMWGLSPRQCRLVSYLSAGLSRKQIAAEEGISEAVVKKDLTDVFILTGVRTSGELLRKWFELKVLNGISDAARSQVTFGQVDPFRFERRPDGGLIAFSDYGPPQGRPVLVVHSSTGCRAIPGVLRDELRAAGFRPIAIDRPGFGLSDELPDGHSADPFQLACNDVRLVMKSLDITKFDIVARGGAQHAVHLVAEMPEMTGRVVLVAPDPPTSLKGPEKGMIGAIKFLYRRRPHTINAFARAIIERTRISKLADIVITACADSEPDRAVMENPVYLSDYIRGFSPFLQGRISGYVREQFYLATGPQNLPHVSSEQFSVLIGEHDYLHKAASNQEYWRGILPDAKFQLVADGGRYLMFSHAGLVSSCLASPPS